MYVPLSGLKRKKSLASVIIKVGDINDNVPEFYIPHPDKVAVEENSPVGTSFYDVTAIDRDSGNYGAVKYSILGGSGWGLFVIDSLSGELSTNATFDYEIRNRYLLEVKAEDGGNPPLTSNVNLTVYIKSVDESDPKFERSRYEFDLPGNAKIGDFVGQVVATDEDEGEDGVVRYSFEFSSSDVFAINGTSGVIFVNKSLEEVNSSRRRRRSVDLADEESTGSRRRVKREAGVTTVTLRVRADSGKAKSKAGLVWVDIGIDFACPGCPTTGARDDEGGIAGSTLSIIVALAVLAGVILIAFIVVMASKLDKDDYVYDVENLSALMASMEADGTEPGARPKKSKRLVEKTAGKSTKAQPPPASSIESHLELEKVKNQNLKMELEITKAQLELAKMKSVSAEPWTPSLGQPHLLQAAITSTPGSALGSGILTLEQLRERKKTGSTLPNNFVFSSKGTMNP